MKRKVERMSSAAELGNGRAIHEHSLAEAQRLQENGQLVEAERIYRELLTHYSSHAGIMLLLGLACAGQERLEEGRHWLEKAIAAKPDYADAYYNLGVVFHKLRFDAQALEQYDAAIRHDPMHVNAHNNRSRTLYQLGRYEEAETSYARAAALRQGENADAWLGISMLNLLQGRYEQGWQLFEWRWKSGEINEARQLTQPLWLGKESLAGKTILLHAEQGLGDTLQFSRYAPLVEQLGANVILEVQKPLVELVQSLPGKSMVIAQGDALPAFDMQCPLMSLPLAMGTTLATIPAQVPYLSVPEEKLALWKTRLGTRTRPRVGLAWSGAAAHKNDYNRSIPLHRLAPLLQYDCEFHAVQKDVKPEDTEFLKQSGILLHADALLDFTDTAALLAEMDVVISVDTSVAHLAGALNRPVWLLLAFVPDFRWLLTREDSPWYRSARLFRQPAVGDWDIVVAKISDALKTVAGNGFTRAQALHKDGKLAEAEQACREALAQHPQHGGALQLLGMLRFQQADIEEGIRLLEKAVALNPQDAQAYYNLGLAFQMLEKQQEAMVCYEQALHIHPDYAAAHGNRGIALSQLGRLQEALAAFDAALAINPGDSQVQHNRAMILARLV